MMTFPNRYFVTHVVCCFFCLGCEIARSQDYICEFPARIFQLDDSPYSCHSEDVDGDGDQDLLIANRSRNILLNPGNGKFEKSAIRPKDPELDYGALSVITCRLNNDNFPDVVYAGVGKLSIFLQVGPDAFEKETQYELDNVRFEDIAAGDLDGDLDEDLVVVDSSPSSDGEDVNIYFNDGNGILSDPVFYSSGDTAGTGASPRAVEIADLNNDSHLDIVVANRSADSITIFFNDGSGGFGTEIDYEVGDGPTDLVLADLNSDGNIDVATSDGFYGDIVSVFLNEGDGVLGKRVIYSAFRDPGGLNAADIDADGDLDLIVTKTSIAENLSILENLGDGSFVDGPTYFSGPEPTGMAIQDFDRDGTLDVALTNTSNDRVVLTRQLPNGEFDLPPRYGGGPTFVTEVAVAEMNCDQIPDVVTSSIRSNNIGTNAVSVAINDGQGELSDPEIYPLNAPARLIRTGDIDGDIDTDVLTIDTVTAIVSILKNNGIGQMTPQEDLLTCDRAGSFALGDWDGDFDLDLAITCRFENFCLLLTNNGSGEYSIGDSFPTGASPMAIVNLDIDSDGDQDLLITSISDDRLIVHLNDGFGNFSTGQQIDIGSNATRISVADIDQDFDDDVLVLDSETYRLIVFLNQGDGTLIEQTDYAVREDTGPIILDDFNLDGSLDLLIGSNSLFTVRLNNGFGVFGPETTYDGNWDAAVGDMNLDGVPDVVHLSSATFVSLNSCTLLGDINSDSSVNLLDVEPLVDAIIANSYLPAADINQDGNVDLLDICPFVELLMN